MVRYPFGSLVKAVREKKGITQKQAAAALGVSESLISQIEGNKVSPSLDTLLSLSEYLEIDPEYLFRQYRSRKSARIIRASERNHIARGGVRYEQLSAMDDGDDHGIEAVLIELDPEGEKGSKGFGHPGRELGYIIQGTAILFYGTNRYELYPGDTVTFSSDIPHRLKNAGTGPLRAVWIITPPKKDYFG